MNDQHFLLAPALQVWVLDARPNAVRAVDKPTKEVLDVLAAVKSIPLPLASRQALYQQLQQKGFSPGAAAEPEPAPWASASPGMPVAHAQCVGVLFPGLQRCSSGWAAT